MTDGDAIEKNRALWEATSDAYQSAHGEALGRAPLAWGCWRIPEAQVGALGDVAGLRVLEYGCGAAQWTHALERAGACAVGMDLSARQLRHARDRARRVGASAPLVRADGERLPFRDGAFDVVFCDHGVMSWARPERCVPQAARALRPGGIFAFCMSTPLHALCYDAATDQVQPTLANEYFALHALEDRESVSFQLPYGAWIRLFRAHGLVVEDLIELRPPPGASTTYVGFAPLEWARRWPAEHVWKCRKAA